MTQAEFADVIGVSEAKVSQLVGEGYIVKGETARAWLHDYLRMLREDAAGRASAEPGGMDVAQERAKLARAQREAQEIKTKIARGEYAPIGLLADVLGMVSSAVVDRFERLEGELRKSSPHLPVEAKDTIVTRSPTPAVSGFAAPSARYSRCLRYATSEAYRLKSTLGMRRREQRGGGRMSEPIPAETLAAIRNSVSRGLAILRAEAPMALSEWAAQHFKLGGKAPIRRAAGTLGHSRSASSTS
ncbi:hypothetical protein [Variovorax paradoxus]|uniref:hypothetical protein n=1 Tax=Variovorax paradoxus TaxID=34073 RepID=UPI003D653BFD